MKLDNSPMRLLAVYERAPVERAFVYAIVASDAPLLVVYVGRTVNPSARLAQHCMWGGTFGSWAREVASRGARVEMRLLEITTMERAIYVEEDWIKRLWASGPPLFNIVHAGAPAWIRIEDAA